MRTAAFGLSLLFACVGAQNFNIRNTDITNKICHDSNPAEVGYFDYGSDAHFFYWMFSSTGNPSKDPIVLMLMGGAGCPNEVSIFAETGPCFINRDGATTSINGNAWNKHATLIYFDVPGKVGFSTTAGSPITNSSVIASITYNFLHTLFSKHPELAALNVTVYGQAFAGHTAISIAHYIQSMNAAPGSTPIKLRGVSVGNGFLYPNTQYDSLPDAAASSNGHPALDAQAVQAMNSNMDSCLELVEACANNFTSDCLTAQNACNYYLVQPYTATGRNPYDMRLGCPPPPQPSCYDFAHIQVFLMRNDTRVNLGSPAVPWAGCNGGIDLTGGWLTGVLSQVPDLLRQNVLVQLYAGDQDFITNYNGSAAVLNNLVWVGQEDYVKAPAKEWFIDDVAVGTVKTAHNLAMVQIYAAGQLVAMDQPIVALAMLAEFLSATPAPRSAN